MTIAQSDEPTRQKPLRLWPGVVAVVLQWLAFYGVPIVMPGPAAGYIAPLGGLVGGLAVIVWWMFLSRTPRCDRWGAIVLMTVALVATSHFLHESIGTGMMRMVFFFYAIPVLSLAFVAWAWPAVPSLMGLGARRWSRPSCWRAEGGRSCGLRA